MERETTGARKTDVNVKNGKGGRMREKEMGGGEEWTVKKGLWEGKKLKRPREKEEKKREERNKEQE